MKILKVGDRVVMTDNCEGMIMRGEIGVVVDIKQNIRDHEVGVRWDDLHDLRHTCGGKCDDFHGWYVPSEFLKRLQTDDDRADMQVLTLENLFI